MDWKALRATLRFDGAAWRRFAELGCVYGPEWWKRGSPPVIAAIIFAIARAQRAAVLANQRQIREPMPGPRGWLRERWHAYRVFAEFARSVTEAMEQWGPRPRPLELHVVGTEIFEAALAEHPVGVPALAEPPAQPGDRSADPALVGEHRRPLRARDREDDGRDHRWGAALPPLGAVDAAELREAPPRRPVEAQRGAEPPRVHGPPRLAERPRS